MPGHVNHNRGIEKAPKKRIAMGGPALPGEPGKKPTPSAPDGRPHLPGEKPTPKPKNRFTV
jgi:hypothetical protein